MCCLLRLLRFTHHIPTSPDADAGFCYLARGSIHRHWKRFHSNILYRGHESTMARRVFSDTWGGTCARSAFWDVRGCEGACGRQQRWKPVASNLYVSRTAIPLNTLSSASLVSVSVFRGAFVDDHSHSAIALAGASATIASDALMNPFDGKLSFFSSIAILSTQPPFCLQSSNNGCRYISPNSVPSSPRSV